MSDGDGAFTQIGVIDWPFPRSQTPTIIISFEWRGEQRGLLQMPDGGLALAFGRDGRLTGAVACQRVVSLNSGALTIRLSVSTREGFSIFLNSERLHIDPLGMLPIRLISPRPSLMPTREPILPAACRNFRTVDRQDALFIRKVLDLQDTVATGDWYDATSAAATLRQLLVDGTTLLSAVNRTRQIRVRFCANQSDIEAGAALRGVQSIVINVEPMPGQTSPPIASLSLEQFLRIPIMVSSGVLIDVRDVIRTMANAQGGVHMGRPDGPAQEAVIAIDRQLGALDPSRMTTMAIGAIGRIALKALLPLVAVILNG